MRKGTEYDPKALFDGIVIISSSISLGLYWTKKWKSLDYLILGGMK